MSSVLQDPCVQGLVPRVALTGGVVDLQEVRDLVDLQEVGPYGKPLGH